MMHGVKGWGPCHGVRGRDRTHMSRGRRRGRTRWRWGRVAACSCAAAHEALRHVQAGRLITSLTTGGGGGVTGGRRAEPVEEAAHLDRLVLDEATLGDVAVVLLRGHVAAARGSRGSDLSPHVPHTKSRVGSWQGGSQAAVTAGPEAWSHVPPVRQFWCAWWRGTSVVSAWWG